jgi:glutaconate CoA-transferase subunit B
MDYTPGELMVCAAAREIQDRQVIFVGMRLPLLAFAVAKNLHAPSAIGLFENGLVREQPAPELLFTMSDNPNVAGALWCTGMRNVMGLLAQGYVDLGFIGGAEVDKYGNLNTSYIGAWQKPQVKLPGSGGAADIASLSKKTLIIMAHERRRFKEKVDYITSPGFGEGEKWRDKVGLPGHGPQAIITTLGILRFDGESREAYLDSYHPGSGVEEIKTHTGWDLKIKPGAAPTPPPTKEELEILRRYDPQKFWTK